ncbi:rhomboid family intramembrane serine protease [Oceanihabitans sp. 2_MG-2023]|uniref:rhomboid family intramembrane serine protease n=1 Tax=Oceanihabitans sp. 2_MG-2023 TaxID=3062661 RepID=UPI0026E39D24|nr:rhomboid family intramembrane serine protease [Oceanihabitans sp. 2_MG-2023]MDO6597852.1 rhomboid family intramembrane serine protease [Oceanihabitans sp. 2_MG-2023]
MQDQFKFTTGVLGYPIAFVLLLWIVFWFEIRFHVNLNSHGIYPKRFSGLQGVLFSPFIHSGIKHLYSNTIPLFILSTALFYFYRPIAWKVLIYGILISGFLTWCIGRPSYHIGASGLIYVLVSFTFFKGILAKHFRLIALSLLVIFLYGSMVWYTMPIEEGISWEGHLSGLVTGFVFAVAFRKEIAKPKKYAWEQKDFKEEEDAFLKHFDENGNFVASIENEIEAEGQSNTDVSNTETTLQINYTFKENKE